MDITTGMKMTLTDTVTMDNAAKTLGSGSLLVYGTPAMLLLVEKTAVALLEGHLDEGMTTVGTTNIKTVFVIDYIDLDYGFIGGYYSLGLSGPAYGGGTGYMLLRLPKNAYPLAPELTAPKTKKSKQISTDVSAPAPSEGLEMTMEVQADTAQGLEEETVKVFPLPAKK